MAQFAGHHPELLAALREMGIEPNNTQKITIEITGGRVPLVTVERFIDEKVLGVLRTLGDHDVVETITSVEVITEGTEE